jgi:esterase
VQKYDDTSEQNSIFVVRFKNHFLTLELYSRDFGTSGQPILILHGLFGFSDNWQTIARQLSENNLVITPDLRNHGRSPHINAHTYADMAADIHHLVTQRGLNRVQIIGHSMGGKVAMQFALNYPELVDRLVVVDMDPGQSTDNHRTVFNALFGVDFSKISTRQEAEDYLSNHIEDIGTRQFLLKNLTRDTETNAFSWKMNLPVLWEHYPDILGPVSGTPNEYVPALFVRGGKSNYIRDTDVPIILSLFPHADLVTIPGAGHWVHADKPQELLEVLRGFLA